MSGNNYFTDTLRDVLDSLIFQLSLDDKTRLSDHQIYLYLYQLVYGSEVTVTINKLPPPYYPYLIVAYHLLFVKKDKERAKQLFNKIKEEYNKTRGIKFSYEEERMYEILNTIFERINLMDHYSPDVCEELKKAINNIRIDEYSWAYFFKQLILVQLGLGNISNNVGQTFNEYKNSLFFPVDEEVAEHFNIISNVRVSRIINYLDKEFERVKRDYEKLNDKIVKLESEKQKLENKYNSISKFIRWINKNSSNVNTIILNTIAIVSVVGLVVYSSIYHILNILDLVLPLGGVIIVIASEVYAHRLLNQIKSKEGELSNIKEEICKQLFQ